MLFILVILVFKKSYLFNTYKYSYKFKQFKFGANSVKHVFDYTTV